MRRGKATGALSDDAVEFLLRELRLTADAWQGDPEYDGTVTLSAAAAHALLATFDRTAGPKRRRAGRASGKAQPTARAKAERIELLRLGLVPTLNGHEGDADLLSAARMLLDRRGHRQDRNARLLAEIEAAKQPPK